MGLSLDHQHCVDDDGVSFIAELPAGRRVSSTDGKAEPGRTMVGASPDKRPNAFTHVAPALRRC